MGKPMQGREGSKEDQHGRAFAKKRDAGRQKEKARRAAVASQRRKTR